MNLFLRVHPSQTHWFDPAGIIGSIIKQKINCILKKWSMLRTRVTLLGRFWSDYSQSSGLSMGIRRRLKNRKSKQTTDMSWMRFSNTMYKMHVVASNTSTLWSATFQVNGMFYSPANQSIREEFCFFFVFMSEIINLHDTVEFLS